MKLLIKNNCQKCDWLKSKVDINKIEVINAESKEGMALLAYYERLEVNQFPLLFLEDEDETTITKTVKIKKIIEEYNAQIR